MASHKWGEQLIINRKSRVGRGGKGRPCAWELTRLAKL